MFHWEVLQLHLFDFTYCLDFKSSALILCSLEDDFISLRENYSCFDFFLMH